MSKLQILGMVAAKEITLDEAEKLLSDQEKKTAGKLYFKVSAKGALSVYGLQRMPVTLYVEQWTRLLAVVSELQAFIKGHDSEFSHKADKAKANGNGKPAPETVVDEDIEDEDTIEDDDEEFEDEQEDEIEAEAVCS
jgi:hypothetical protein